MRLLSKIIFFTIPLLKVAFIILNEIDTLVASFFGLVSTPSFYFSALFNNFHKSNNASDEYVVTFLLFLYSFYMAKKYSSPLSLAMYG